MNTGRTLLLAVDGLDTGENFPHPLLTGTSLATATALTLHPGGPSEPPPALASLVTGGPVAHTGVATAVPLPPDRPESRSTWYARSLAAPTLFDQLRREGRVAAALQWPATAGAEIDLCLPLVEDLRHYRNRWDMAVSTSSPRMVQEHLEPRRRLACSSPRSHPTTWSPRSPRRPSAADTSTCSRRGCPAWVPCSALPGRMPPPCSA